MLHTITAIVRRLRFAGLAAILFTAGLFAVPQLVRADESPIGSWKTIDDETGETKSIVKIYERDGKLYGKITKLLKNPGATCDACEGEVHGAPIEGMIIMWSLEQD